MTQASAGLGLSLDVARGLGLSALATGAAGAARAAGVGGAAEVGSVADAPVSGRGGAAAGGASSGGPFDSAVRAGGTGAAGAGAGDAGDAGAGDAGRAAARHAAAAVAEAPADDGGSGLRRVLAMGTLAAAPATASASATGPLAADGGRHATVVERLSASIAAAVGGSAAAASLTALPAAAAFAAAAPAGAGAIAGRASASAAPAAVTVAPSAPAAPAAPTTAAPRAALQQLPVAADHLARAVDLQALLLAAPTLADGALALLTELAPMLGCERATLAVVDGRELEIVALSNSADWKPEQTLLRQLAAAMHESLDQGVRVSHPAAAGDTLRIVLAHAALRAATGHVVASLPLWSQALAAQPAASAGRPTAGLAASDPAAGAGQAVGALLVEGRGQAPFDAEQLALCEAVAGLIGPLVDLRRRAERPWRARLAARWRAAVERLRRPDDPWPKVAGGGALLVGGAALAAAAWLPLPYRIGAPVRVEGAVQRVVAAPIDGYLGRVLVRPGDSVRAGELLVELADGDLLLEQRKWESALAQHDNGVSAALARADRAQFVVSQGRAGEARAQLDLVREQLSRTRLLAPMDGVVIKGDLGQTLGAPVQRGDVLLTLAPLQQFRLVAEVDERDIAAVRAGQTGRLALAAMPVDPLPFVVQRVTPVAVQRDGRNAYEIEARLVAPAGVLRPGLEGVARIDAGRRPLAWQWSHRAVDWLRMAWWGWW